MIPYRLEILEKTGFRNISGNPVIILDERGKPFYDTRNLDRVVWEFNLPAGIYQVVSGKISKRVNPVIHGKMPLPKPERYKRDNPNHFAVVFTDNPNKCTVDWRNKVIKYDNQFKNADLPTIVFIYHHEMGHRYYETERYCDAYAYNQMIEDGYNPSQIGYGIVDTLSNSNQAYERKVDLVSGMINNTDNHLDHFTGKNDFDRLSSYNYLDSPEVGQYVVSDLGVKVYEYPGGKYLYSTTPKGYIGKVSGMNSRKTWIDLTPGGSLINGNYTPGEWIINNENLKFIDRLTDFQRADFANRYASPETKAKIQAGGIADTDGTGPDAGGFFSDLFGSFDLKSVMFWIVVILILILLIKLQ